MRTVKYVSWEEDGAWLGYLQEYPDYWTQGETLDDLKEHLRDLYNDLTSGQIPGIRKVDELEVSRGTENEPTIRPFRTSQTVPSDVTSREPLRQNSVSTGLPRSASSRAYPDLGSNCSNHFEPPWL